MEYNERVRLITMSLNSFLRQYQRPTHLDTDGSLIEIKTIAEEINNLISASSNQDALAERVETCFKSLRRNYTQRTWPTVAHFVKAMNEIHAASPAIEGRGGELKSPAQIAADRMNAGDAVGDGWIYGKGALALLEARLVSDDVMRRYRSAMYFLAKDAASKTSDGNNEAGKEYADKIEAKLIARHDRAVQEASDRRERMGQ